MQSSVWPYKIIEHRFQLNGMQMEIFVQSDVFFLLKYMHVYFHRIAKTKQARFHTKAELHLKIEGC